MITWKSGRSRVIQFEDDLYCLLEGVLYRYRPCNYPTGVRNSPLGKLVIGGLDEDEAWRPIEALPRGLMIRDEGLYIEEQP